jgi:hypothetical protein
MMVLLEQIHSKDHPAIGLVDRIFAVLIVSTGMSESLAPPGFFCACARYAASDGEDRS